MKRCPACQRTYPDDQNFCFDDGTTLVGAPAGSFDSSEAPTANYPFHGSSSAPTEIMHGAPTTSGGRPLATSPPPAFMTPYPQKKRSPVPWIVGGALVLIVGIVLAVFLGSRTSGSGTTTTGTSGTSSGTTSSSSSTSTTTTTTSSSSWEGVTGDGFTISMPGTPAKNEDTIPSAAGPLLLRMYTLTKGFEGFITGYTEYPDIVFSSAEPETLLDGAQQGAISNVKGEVTSQRAITINGHPGREIVGVSPAQNVGFTARVYLVKPRMYMLVYTQYDKSKPISADGQKFLDSFQLTN
jgi:hypothetical protein